MEPHPVTKPTGDEDMQNMLTCFECDAPAITEWCRHTFTYGFGSTAVELTVNLPVRTCGSCGFEFLDHEAETLKHEAICTHLGVLSPKEIHSIRRMHSMSRAAFAQVTGLGEATLNRWENGIVIQTLANDRYLRLLANPATMQRLKSFGSAERSSSLAVDGRRFRCLEESDDVRREQDGFQLRRAA